MKLFAKTEVNTTRQWAFDFTKTLAIHALLTPITGGVFIIGMT